MPKKRLHLLVLAPLALALLNPTAVFAANQLRVESETLFRWYQGELSNDEKTGAPAYEYLRLDYGALDADGFSAHLYGWGRYDFGDYYSDNTAGEFLYGYVQYSDAAAGFLARLGRQYLFQTGSTASLDGLFLSSDITPLFAVAAYAGQPVTLETTNGRAGDSLWGGRIAHHWKGLYELGVSYKREDNDSDENTETLGVDVSVTPPWPVSLYGYSKRNLVTDEWAEHSYELRLNVASFRVRPFFQRFETGDYLDAGVGTPKPFKDLLFLNGSDTVTIAGADASWRSAGGLELVAKGKHYDYSEADTSSWYGSGGVIQHWADATEVGGEIGRMSGDSDEDRYTIVLVHGYLEKVPFSEKVPVFLSADFAYAHYDEDVNGKSRSIFASVGGGVKLASDRVKVKLSGDYSSDPYFDSRFRLLAGLDFTFDK